MGNFLSFAVDFEYADVRLPVDFIAGRMSPQALLQVALVDLRRSHVLQTELADVQGVHVGVFFGVGRVVPRGVRRGGGGEVMEGVYVGVFFGVGRVVPRGVRRGVMY